MAILARRGYQSVAELAGELDVSEMTIRRYLDRLEEQQQVKRTHGGAYLGQEMIEVDYRIRETVRRAEKEAIGRLAFSMIQPGESVFVDSGTTAAFLAYAINDSKRITVVTMSLVAAQALEGRTAVQTLLLGGTVHAATHSVIGPLAEESIGQFRFNQAFLGASAISLTDGLSQSTYDEIPVKRKAALHAQRVVVLADSDKLHKHAPFLFMPLDQVTALVTDTRIRSEDRQALEEKGVEIHLAEVEG
jgi:DeoR/GlpR family transcriptional regulator of sugar metabolism